MPEENILQTAIAAVTKGRTPVQLLAAHAEELKVPCFHIAAVPNDMAVRDLSPELDRLATKLQPWQRTGTAQLTDLPSFIAWANRHKGETSAIFAEVTDKPGLTCVADYIGEGAPVISPNERDPKASHMRHRGVYAFPLSREWQTWNKVSGTILTKAELGEFIEANAKDFMQPTPAVLAGRPEEPWEERLHAVAQQLRGRFGDYQTLLQLSRQFQVNETANLATSLNPDTGESTIQFLNEHQAPDGSPVRIPNLFLVAIPVFDNGALYRLPVRFRYRKAGSDLRFTLTLHNPDVAFRDAVDEAVATAASETQLPVFRGRPEAA